MDSIVIHGSFLLDKIRKSILLNEDCEKLFKELVPNDCDSDVIEIIMKFLLRIYTIMRLKDFCYKLFKKGSKLKTTTRNAQIVLSNPEHHAKKRKKLKFHKVSEEIDEIIEDVVPLVSEEE